MCRYRSRRARYMTQAQSRRLIRLMSTLTFRLCCRSTRCSTHKLLPSTTAIVVSAESLCAAMMSLQQQRPQSHNSFPARAMPEFSSQSIVSENLKQMLPCVPEQRVLHTSEPSERAPPLSLSLFSLPGDACAVQLSSKNTCDL